LSTLQRKLPQTSAGRYLLAAVLCGVFSAVYEAFSHGVRSVWMIGLGGVPLLLGALPFLLLALRGAPVPDPGARRLWRAGVATLTVGCALAGALEIYGTTTPYLPAYWAAGGLMLAGGALRYGRAVRRARKRFASSGGI
jgi:hypothetical protein